MIHFREVDRATATLLAVPAKTNNGNALFKNKFRVRAYYESMPGFAQFYSKHGMSQVQSTMLQSKSICLLWILPGK